MLYQQITQNKRRTLYVLCGFSLLVLAIGGALGYVFANNVWYGLLIALIATFIYAFLMINNDTSIVMGMNHAHEVSEAQQPQLYHVVQDMALVARLPMPKVYIVDTPALNAFATGNDPQHAAVAVTQGLLDKMDREELEGVIGHEISHIRNYDIRLQTIALVLSSVITFLVDWCSHWFWWGNSDDDNNNNNNNPLKIILLVIIICLGPLAATIAQMALSRNREYLADASSVDLTRNPKGLIRALETIKANEQPIKNVPAASAAMYLDDPLKNKRHFWNDLFDTHPPIDERIKRLEAM